MSKNRQSDPAKPLAKWLYRIAPGGGAPVSHAIRADVPQLAQCGARGPFIPRAFGEPKDCPVCARIVADFAALLRPKHDCAETGRRGGMARAERLTAEEREVIARKAAKHRWSLDRERKNRPHVNDD